jgi:hypothetical protein
MAKMTKRAKIESAMTNDVVLYDVVCNVEHLLGSGLDVRTATALAQTHNNEHQNETPKHNATLTRRQP